MSTFAVFSIYVHQKPVVEQLCLYLTQMETKHLFQLSPQLFRAFSRESTLKTALGARVYGYDWIGAAVYGRLDIICFLHENNVPGCTTDAMDLPCTENNFMW